MATTIPTAAPSTLEEAVRKLALARSAVFAVKTALTEKRAAFNAENAALLMTEKEAAASVAAAEADVRALALAAYEQTKARKPTAGVEIKVLTALEYPADKALEWARKAEMCLIPEQLDAAAFVKVATATKLPFVKYIEQPKVFVASDLEKALATAELTAPAPTEPAAGADDEDSFA